MSAFLENGSCVRSLYTLTYDGDTETKAPAFPTRLELDMQMCENSREFVAADVARFYELVRRADGSPVQLNAAVPEVPGVTTLWQMKRKCDQELCVVKVSFLVETPIEVRAAYTLLCQMELDSRQGHAITTDVLLAIRKSIAFLDKTADGIYALSSARRTALAVLGYKASSPKPSSAKSSSSSAASAAAAAAAAAAPHTTESTGADSEGEALCSTHQSTNLTGHQCYGHAFFSRTCIAVARRLCKRMFDLRPSTVEESEWGRLVKEAFEPWIDRMDNLPRQYRKLPGNRARLFDNAVNNETMNDVVAGGHATFLHICNIASALTPMIDYFSSSTSGMSSTMGSGSRLLYSVYPFYRYSLANVLRTGGALGINFDKPSAANLAVIRAMLGQMLVALSAAQHVAQYVHYDLHTANVLCDYTRSGMAEYGKESWRYRVPVGLTEEGDDVTFKDVVIPAATTSNMVLRIIDHGRSRIDRPGYWGNPECASRIDARQYAVNGTFDAGCDTRAFGHDFVFYTLASWIPTLCKARSSRLAIPTLPPVAASLCTDLADLVDVLEAMTGMESWKEWQYGSYARVDSTDGLHKPACFMDYASLFRAGLVSSARTIRTQEFFSPRKESPRTGSPSAILGMAFFKTYVSDVDETQETVADATVVPRYCRAKFGEMIDDRRTPSNEEEGVDGAPEGTPTRRDAKRNRPGV